MNSSLKNLSFFILAKYDAKMPSECIKQSAVNLLLIMYVLPKLWDMYYGTCIVLQAIIRCANDGTPQNVKTHVVKHICIY